MEKKIVIFTGQDKDQYGMPAPFYFYGVFVSQYKQDSKYVVVTKMGFTLDTPRDTENTKLIEAQSETAAIKQAIEELKNFGANQGLTMQICDMPEIKL